MVVHNFIGRKSLDMMFSVERRTCAFKVHIRPWMRRFNCAETTDVGYVLCCAINIDNLSREKRRHLLPTNSIGSHVAWLKFRVGAAWGGG